MARYADESTPVKTFSVGFGRNDDELRYARLVSDNLGTDHEEIFMKQDAIELLPEVIWHTDEPIADPAMIPVYVMSKQAKKHATVVLTGDGGDELFAGYEQHKFLRFAQRARAIPGLRSLVKAGLTIAPSSLLNKKFKYASALGSEGIRRAKQLLDADTGAGQYLAITSIFSPEQRAELGGRKPGAEKDIKWHFSTDDAIADATRFEFDVQLAENMLMKSDKMTMAHAVEPRVPLLDTKVLEVARKIPFSLRLRGGTEKYILRKAIAPWVPKETVKRKKQRFYVPIDDWLKQSAPVLDRVFSPGMMRHGLLDRHAVQKIRDNYKRAPLFYARQLWTLMTFQLWYERFIL
jgi:asparagine synthase (glutamine-hydrolysing)